MFWGEDNGFVQLSQTSSAVPASKHRASASGILCSEGDPTKVVSGWSQGSAFSFVCVCVYVFQHESWTARLYNELVSQLSGKGRGGKLDAKHSPNSNFQHGSHGKDFHDVLLFCKAVVLQLSRSAHAQTVGSCLLNRTAATTVLLSPVHSRS